MSHAEKRPGRAVQAPLVRGRAREVASQVHADDTTATPGRRYQGLVTRAIAFALDAAVINLVALAVAVTVGLAVSILDLSSQGEKALYGLGGIAWFLWSTGYFVVCWAATGQTPGNRLLHIRVCDADDLTPLSPLRAAFRLLCLTLAALPLFAGFLPVLVDKRRRGVHDMLAGSVVIGSDPP